MRPSPGRALPDEPATGTTGVPAAFGTIAGDGVVDDATWRRLLARDPADVGLDPLYGPLLAPATAVDGCFVVGRIAQSLDGRIATAGGHSFWISGAEDVLHTHRLRALSDVVVVGAGTVCADDPQLTTRDCAGSSPVRVVLDTERRLTDAHRVFQTTPSTLLAVADDLDGPDRLGRASVLRLPRAAHGGGIDLGALLDRLAARGLCRVFVEGGGVTLSRFLAAGRLDRMHVTIAPLILGSGIPGFTLPCVTRPEHGMRLDWRLYRLGRDLLFDIPLDRARPSGCP